VDETLSFLGFFAPRVICAPCLARIVDEGAAPTFAWLEGKVADGSLSVTKAACLNCEDMTTVYRLA
jgi:hypothetical protein